MSAAPMSAEHNIMTCPACGHAIYAEVTIDPNIGQPTLTTNTEVVLTVKPTIKRFKITHLCTGRIHVGEADGPIAAPTRVGPESSEVNR